MPTFRNPFGLEIRPEPDATLPGDHQHHAEVTVHPQGFIPAHYHQPGPDGIYDHGNAEIYHWLGGGSLQIFLRASGRGRWQTVLLSEENRTIAILAGWHHGAVAIGKTSVVFRALSRVDHFRANDQGGNVHRLPDGDQPLEIRHLMRASGA